MLLERANHKVRPCVCLCVCVCVCALVLNGVWPRVGAGTRLPHIDMIIKPPSYPEPPSIRITVKGSETHAPTYQSQVQTLKHVRLAPQHATKVTVLLVGWSMTTKAYKALAHLPAWGRSTLDLSECTSWPLSAARNADMLLKYVPGCFKRWRFPDTKLHSMVQDLVAIQSKRGAQCY